MASIQEALETIRGLGTVERMRAVADQTTVRPLSGANSHIHLPPNFSAFESVAQAVTLAADQGVRVVGVTNYYDHRVYGEFAALARKRGVLPLFGLEIISLLDALVRAGTLINDPGNPGRMYLCGKGALGVAAPSARAAELLGIIRRNDTARMAEMTDKTAACFRKVGFETGLDAGKVIDGIVARHGCPRNSVTIQERHIAMAFQQALFALSPVERRAEAMAALYGKPAKSAPDDAVAVQGEIRSNLLKAGKPAFVAETFLRFEQARELILALDAIPCYPTLADGANPICEYETPPEKLIGQLQQAEIRMAEFIPIRNTPDVLARYVRAMRTAGIAVVAGTEHNTLELLPVEPRCLRGAEVPPDLKAIFWEGACVVAAHQFLRLHGQCGFVDAQGRPHPGWPTAEKRIDAFARMGQAVIQTYFDRHPASTGASRT